jgi:predicted ATPase
VTAELRAHTSPGATAGSLTHLAVAGYRSLQQLTLPLGGHLNGGLTLVCGANGSGKSNLYRSLGLIAAAARGDLVAALAAEGGLPAVFWAGPERTSAAMRRGEQPVQGSSGRREAARLRLGIAGTTLSYAIELGYRADDHTSAFVLDPEIKREWIWAGGPFHPRSLLVQRNGPVVERCGDPGLALLRQLSHRPPGAGAGRAHRHPHPVAGGRWR